MDNRILYYKGFALGQEFVYTGINEDQIHLLEACLWMLNNRETIRVTAYNCDFSKTTFHKKIHTELKTLSPEMYQCIKKRMKLNVIYKRRRK